MLKTIMDWILYYIKAPIQSVATKHSDKIITTFLYMNYVAVIFNDLCNKYNIRFKRSTKLVLPLIPSYYAKCFYYQIENKYYLYWEYNSDIHYPIYTSDHKAIHLYKHPEYTLCYISDKNIKYEAPVHSRAKFINILYSNPVLQNPLTLHLDHAFLQADNEILSASHVLYLLSTQYESSEYVFDMSYELKIMDSNLNLHILKSDMYLLLDAKGFTQLTV